jgi:hypothetical protein
MTNAMFLEYRECGLRPGLPADSPDAPLSQPVLVRWRRWVDCSTPPRALLRPYITRPLLRGAANSGCTPATCLIRYYLWTPRCALVRLRHIHLQLAVLGLVQRTIIVNRMRIVIETGAYVVIGTTIQGIGAQAADENIVFP